MIILIIKERFPPLALLTLDACISRLREGHPKLKILRQNAASYQKGFNGERKLDYHLKILDNSFVILSDVTLSIYEKQFQMDSLVITSNALFIIEVKSLEGTITFHTSLKQLTQDNGQKLIGRKHPITQAENISFHFMRWLQFQKLDGLPIYYFVAIADQSTIIHVNGDEDAIRKVVSHVDEIPIRLVKMNEKLIKTMPENHQLKNRIIQTVLKNCEELQIDILSRFDIHENDILPGVHCPSCKKLKMIRTRFNWHCSYCKVHSRTAHRKALLDFALIDGTKITNKQCQYFLHTNRSTAYSILKNTEGVTLIPKKKKWVLEVDKLRIYV